MGIENNINKPSIQAPQESTPKTEKNNFTNPTVSQTPDLSDLHEAKENKPHKVLKPSRLRPGKKQIDPKKLNFFEKFLHDNWGIRTFFALGNEIAESCYELAEHLLPKPIAKALYGGFWSLTTFKFIVDY